MADLWGPVNGVFTASASWLPTLDFWDKFEWFPFFMATMGAVGGAFAGAWFAHRIAERSRQRAELERELREVNTAIMIALSTVNLAYGLKKQHIKKMKDSHDADCARYKEYALEYEGGADLPPFVLNPNVSSIHTISPPIHILQDIVLGKLAIGGRGLAVVTTLGDAVGNLNNAISKRNDILDGLKKGALPPGADAKHLYLGLPYAKGQANNEWGGYISAMALYVNDVMFFGMKLCEDLSKHGKSLALDFQKHFGGDLKKVLAPQWSKADGEGMLPVDEDYKEWLKGFLVTEATKRTRWQVLKKRFTTLSRQRSK